MEPTRRLSLTLLLVTPIIAARTLSSEDLGLTGVSEAWSGLPDIQTESDEDWGSSTEPSESYDTEPYNAAYSDFGAWLRRKRDLDAPGDDLETAEQVLFRPTFRYKHLKKAREERRKLREELRRQFTQNSPIPAPSSPAVASLPASTAQRKYYSSQKSPISAASSPSVVSLPTAAAQRKYYNYPQQSQVVPTSQRVFSPQVSPVQRVYSPQISPNYPRLVANPSRYASAQSFPQNNQGYKPQRSPYAYFYSQRLN